jgi:predicted GIY-YIG superfamily endonuclease
MVADSKQWEEAYKSYKRPRKPRTARRPISPTELQKEYANNRREIMRLQKRQTQLKKQMSRKNISTLIRPEYFDKTIHIYVLRLAGDNWYIGSSRNVKKRFGKHLRGKGAKWTALHEPIEIVETFDTGINDDRQACLKEDELTIEYALKHCAKKVRGGGYSQVKVTPNWPIEVTEAEKICSHT